MKMLKDSILHRAAKAKNTTGPAVACAYDRLVAVRQLKVNLKNPNKHGAEQLRVYAKVLWHQGWRRAIVVSNQSGLIVTGEGAWLTAVKEGWPTVPVDFQDFASVQQELQHLLADNSLPQLADVDEQELAAILAQDLGGLDAELAGVLEDGHQKPELRPVSVKAPPKMAWVLVGIPLVRFSEINSDIERIAGLEGTIVETTVNDGKLPSGRKA
jgi:hypothetical protein